MRLPNQTMVPFLAGLLLAGTSAFVAEEMRKRGIEDLIPRTAICWCIFLGAKP